MPHGSFQCNIFTTACKTFIDFIQISSFFFFFVPANVPFPFLCCVYSSHFLSLLESVLLLPSFLVLYDLDAFEEYGPAIW